MSLGTTFDLQALASVQGAQSKQSVGQSGKQAAPLQAAFQTQLRMAQSLFGEGSQLQGEGSSPGAVGESFIGDAMMMEALTAITQLMRSEAGLPKPVAAAGKTASASVDGNASLANVVESLGLGSLSAKFESGTEGVAAIGYDRVGGTSYGKYQIASKPGTMDRFLRSWTRRLPSGLTGCARRDPPIPVPRPVPCPRRGRQLPHRTRNGLESCSTNSSPAKLMRPRGT